MKNILFFISLLIFISCSSRRSQTKPNIERKSEVRAKIIKCISAAEGISENLKNHINELKKSDERIPFNFNKINLEDKDKEIIRTCKREAFQERRKRNRKDEL